MGTTHRIPVRGLLIGVVAVLTVVVMASGMRGLRWTAWAAPPPQAVEQETLDVEQERNITLRGVEPFDRSGVVATGDLNNDGADDLIVGASLADQPGGLPQVGKTYLMFGPLEGETIELSAADVTVVGLESHDFAGRAVATGDINNDGIADLIIGAPGGDAPDRPESGKVYVLFGPGPRWDLANNTGIIVHGIKDHDSVGIGVGSGDLNGDGADDLIIGAPDADPGDDRINGGKVYVVFGPLASGTVELATSVDTTVNGSFLNHNIGSAVAAGDINNDGQDDLIIGAKGGTPAGRTNAGSTYVLFGPVIAGTLELDEQEGLTINGVDLEDESGVSVGSGDVNNDGAADILIGAPGASPDRRLKGGASYVLHGPLQLGTMELSTDASIVFRGIKSADKSGVGVATGDLNNDGQQDVIIGASHAVPGEVLEAGATYVMLSGVEPVSGGLGTVTLIAIVVVAVIILALAVWLLTRGRGTTPDDSAVGPAG